MPSPDEGQISHADWSPEAGKLLFLLGPVTDGRERGDVWTMNATGTGQRVLAEGEYAHPVWYWMVRRSAWSWSTTPAPRCSPTSTPVDAPDIPPSSSRTPPPGEVAIPVWGTR